MNGTITNLSQMTDSAMTFTKDVTTRWSSRIVGSDSCLACGIYLKEQLATFCDRSSIEQFAVRPGGFLGYIKINVVLYMMSIIALWLQSTETAVVFASIALSTMVFEFLMYKEYVDFLFPKKTGQNVVGTIEPNEVVKQQIIISAHHDSAHIFNFLADDPTSYSSKVMRSAAALIGLFLLTWILFIANLFEFHSIILHWSITILLTVGLPSTMQMWFFHSREGTPGAGDNMICTGLAMEIGKYFAAEKQAGRALKHTRIIIASWDGEEAGLRGARAYNKYHKTDLQQVKTYNFNLECMYDHEEMSFLTSDLNSFVQLSAPMAQECSSIANKLGYKIPLTTFPLMAGGTDAAEFAKNGIEATCLAAMSWTKRGDKPAYHTLRDTIDAVDALAVKRSIEIGINYVMEKDRSLKTSTSHNK